MGGARTSAGPVVALEAQTALPLPPAPPYLKSLSVQKSCSGCGVLPAADSSHYSYPHFRGPEPRGQGVPVLTPSFHDPRAPVHLLSVLCAVPYSMPSDRNVTKGSCAKGWADPIKAGAQGTWHLLGSTFSSASSNSLQSGLTQMGCVGCLCGVPGRAGLTGPDVMLMGEISPLFISLLSPNCSDPICVPRMPGPRDLGLGNLRETTTHIRRRKPTMESVFFIQSPRELKQLEQKQTQG